MPLQHVHCHVVTERQSDVLHKQIAVTEIQYNYIEILVDVLVLVIEYKVLFI